LEGIICADYDLANELLVAERMTVHVGNEEDAQGVGMIRILLKHSFAQPADAADGLREDNAIELQIVVGGRLLCSSASPGLCLDNALVGHGALLVKAVHERTRSNNLRLRALPRSLSLLIHRVHIVE